MLRFLQLPFSGPEDAVSFHGGGKDLKTRWLLRPEIKVEEVWVQRYLTQFVEQFSCDTLANTFMFEGI